MSATWITPITDRQEADIVNQTTKAYVNATDLNRIEGNLAYLQAALQSLQYPVAIEAAKTDWTRRDLPNVTHLRRICRSVMAFAAQYCSPAGFADVSALPDTALEYIGVNRLENDLRLLKAAMDGMVASYKQASFKSGATLFLPIRRV